jgi:transcriptional regulator with XRE-family HTH domain
MAQQELSIVDTHALASLTPRRANEPDEPSAGRWVRILRLYLRMTQAELAKKAEMTQPHLAAIEMGRVDPQVGTLRRLFAALQCRISIRPVPEITLEQQLRTRAKRVALEELERSFGRISLQKIGAEARVFQRLLDKKTEEIMHDRRVRLRGEA